MTKFSDFGIKSKTENFTGDKIDIERVFNVEILIEDFKIEDSTVKIGTKRLTLQIKKGDEKRIIFTGSKNLINMISEVPKDKLPFSTKIIKNEKRYEFT